MSGTCAISTTSRSRLLSSFFSLQGKALKEIHAILTETACFLPGRAKDLSAPLYLIYNAIFGGDVFPRTVFHPSTPIFRKLGLKLWNQNYFMVIHVVSIFWVWYHLAVTLHVHTLNMCKYRRQKLTQVDMNPNRFFLHYPLFSQAMFTNILLTWHCQWRFCFLRSGLDKKYKLSYISFSPYTQI